MDKLEYKIKLIEHCKSLIEERIATVKEAMNEAQQSANEYGPPKDRYDAFRAQLLRKKDMMSQQLVKLLDEKNMLDKINIKSPYKSVEFGAFVKTSNQTLFVAIGIGKVHFEREDVFVISPSVPILKALIGKKIESTFIFNGTEHSVLDIF